MIVNEYLQALFETVIKAVPIELPLRTAVAPEGTISITPGLLEDQVYPSTIGFEAFFTDTETDLEFPSPTATTFEFVVRYVIPASSSELFPTTTSTFFVSSVAGCEIVISDWPHPTGLM